MISDYIKNKLYTYLKYITIIVFLNNIIHYTENNYIIEEKIYNYHNIIVLLLLTLIIVLSVYSKKSLAIILSLVTILYIDRYDNYKKEGFKTNDTITMNDIKNYYTDCKKNKWSGEKCKIIKNEIIDLCQKNIDMDICPPWKKTHHKDANIIIDCPSLYNDLYPDSC